LAELHRDALKSFIETIFANPQKALQMQDLNNPRDERAGA